MNGLTQIAASSSMSGHRTDWIDRAIAVYLLSPTLLFCLWYTPFVALGLIILTGYGLYASLTRERSRQSSFSARFLVGILVLSIVWITIAGVGHVFYANADWLIRDAVLHDLTVAGWPPTYVNEVGEPLILRAPVGYYLPAASIGRVVGLAAAHIGLHAWTTVGWGLLLAGACRMFENRGQRVLCILVLMFFGGMDLLGYIWATGILPSPGEHIEWWMGNVQYSSNTSLMFWVPNHALPAWLGTVLILRHWRTPELARITPLLATAIPLWSPLAAIGLFPFFLFGLAWRRDWRTLFSPSSCLPFAPVAVVTAIYLGMDATEVPHGFLAPLYPSLAEFAYRYVLFCMLEFGLLALVLKRLITLDTPMWIAVVVLCLLPFYFYGPGNDLAMRASIPSLMVLALACVKALTQHERGVWRAALSVILGIGALGAAQEPIRSFVRTSWSPADRSLPESMKAMSPHSTTFFPPHYFAHARSDGLGSFLRTPMPVESRENDEAP